jgi:trans-aconitate methyltransferase
VAILISNPKTGRYASGRLRPAQELVSQLKSLGLDVELKLTAGPGDATELACARRAKRIT